MKTYKLYYLITPYLNYKGCGWLIAQNNKIMGEKDILNSSQIDIFPPFSGG